MKFEYLKYTLYSFLRRDVKDIHWQFISLKVVFVAFFKFKTRTESYQLSFYNYTAIYFFLNTVSESLRTYYLG